MLRQPRPARFHPCTNDGAECGGSHEPAYGARMFFGFKPDRTFSFLRVDKILRVQVLAFSPCLTIRNQSLKRLQQTEIKGRLQNITDIQVGRQKMKWKFLSMRL